MVLTREALVAALRRTPHLRLYGLEARIDLLYSGEMLRATTSWWNSLLKKNSEFAKYEFPPFDEDRLATLQSAVNPKNRWTFKAVGDHIAGFGSLSEAATALAYAFARTYVAGATTGNDPFGGGWAQGIEITEHDWEVLQVAYSEMADWEGYVERGPWWDFHENQTTTTRFSVRAIRWAYRDQVKRWGAAIGTPIENSIGFDRADGEPKDFVDLLFEWGARIQHAESDTGVDPPDSAKSVP
jgi:hypothetical protein